MKMKLDKIKPFNDVWYLNCMMQSIIPIVKYYQPESNEFFLNDKIIYDVKGNTIRQINVAL